ncbi:MAG: hypothetical protein KBC11_02005 [Candidatus Pacebacteria bacterium]|nr:hypothetical protein [Candidatus Paceibacterota bacterium]
MSLEQPNQKPEGSAVEIEGSEHFDAKGNPRTMRTIPETGVSALMSQEEYEEALEGSK